MGFLGDILTGFITGISGASAITSNVRNVYPHASHATISMKNDYCGTVVVNVFDSRYNMLGSLTVYVGNTDAFFFGQRFDC